MAGAKPSYGHLALATLMRANLCRLAWTTNFDPLVADACAKVYGGTGYLTTVALDAPDLAKQSIDEGRWPVEIKLHGDFRSRRLKNTTDELRLQDERLRQVFVDSCRRLGLVVAGYSGRDASAMDALDQAAHSGAFPAGLFWLHRGDDAPLSRVQGFLAKAAAAGIEAAIVRIENFDEIMRDLIRLKPDIDTRALQDFAVDRRRWTGAPVPAGHRGWPVVRLADIHLRRGFGRGFRSYFLVSGAGCWGSRALASLPIWQLLICRSRNQWQLNEGPRARDAIATAATLAGHRQSFARR